MGTASFDDRRWWRVREARWLSVVALGAALAAFSERDSRAAEPETSSPQRCDADGNCQVLPAAPSGFSLGVERLFGQTWVVRSRDGTDGSIEENFDSFNLFAAQTPHEGYSSPRLAADYLFDFGLTLGGALGYHGVRRDGYSADAWVLAPRAGYFWHFSRWVGLWPRAGLTWLIQHDDGDSSAEDELAVSLELPLVILVAQQRLGLLLEPYVDIGLPGGAVDLDERGVQVGVTVFF
ncbi:MAG TPA: hypothetical protein VMG12_23630 [Polyangiaceae bacterium]|nr:hypothetical protein [Polyangiaceae bacterium]